MEEWNIYKKSQKGQGAIHRKIALLHKVLEYSFSIFVLFS